MKPKSSSKIHDKLYRAVQEYVEFYNGNLVVIGGVALQQFPSDSKACFLYLRKMYGRTPQNFLPTNPMPNNDAKMREDLEKEMDESMLKCCFFDMREWALFLFKMNKDLREELNETKRELEKCRNQIDQLINHCDKELGECSECGKIICPHKDPLHFHHDGCPSCYSDIAPKQQAKEE